MSFGEIFKFNVEKNMIDEIHPPGPSKEGEENLVLSMENQFSPSKPVSTGKIPEFTRPLKLSMNCPQIES